MGFVDNDTLSGSLATAAVLASNVGGYTITQGTLAAGSNYALTFNSGTLTVAQAALIITPTGLQRKAYGQSDPSEFAFTASGWKLTDNDSLLSGALTRVAGENAGQYAYLLDAITLSSGNYAVSLVTGSHFTIDPATLIITPTVGQSKIYGESNPFAFLFTASGWQFTDDDSLFAGGQPVVGTAAATDPAEFLHRHGELGQPVTLATRGLREVQAEQPLLGERGPQLVVVRLARAVDHRAHGAGGAVPLRPARHGFRKLPVLVADAQGHAFTSRGRRPMANTLKRARPHRNASAARPGRPGAVQWTG